MAKQTIPDTGLWSTIAALINSNATELYAKQDGWIDVLADLHEAVGLPASAQPDLEKIIDDGSGSTGIYIQAFDDGSIESLLTTFHIPHGIKDLIIYPHIHWTPFTTDTGVVRWGIEWSYAAGYGRGTFPNTTITYIEQAGGGTIGEHLIAEVSDPGIEVTGLETDGLIMARIFRDATHANDTFVGDAGGLFVDLHMQVERLTTPNRNYPFD